MSDSLRPHESQHPGLPVHHQLPPYYIIIACLLTCLPLSLDKKLHEGLYPYLLAQYVSVCSVAQLCPTLLDLMNCSLSGSSVHGISQARILEWVAISFSRGSSRPRDQTRMHLFCLLHWHPDSLPLSSQRSPLAQGLAHSRHLCLWNEQIHVGELQVPSYRRQVYGGRGNETEE